MGVVMVAVIAIVIIIFISNMANKNDANKTSSSSKSVNRKNVDMSNLNHGDCNINVGDSCLHIDVATDTDTKACKGCGYQNVKKAKRCSVCGRRLF